MASYFYRIKNAIVGDSEPALGDNQQKSEDVNNTENDIKSPTSANSASSKNDPNKLSTYMDRDSAYSNRFKSQNESTNKQSYYSNNGSSVKEYDDEFYLTNSQILDDKATLHKPVIKKRIINQKIIHQSMM